MGGKMCMVTKKCLSLSVENQSNFMERLKKGWQRFNKWQREPVKYVIDEGSTVECLNCGQKYCGNFCPACGQKASVSRLSFHKVWRGAMDVWGLGGSSMLKNMVCLILRPGYLIADYLEGRRQMYFPPFKMLFLFSALLFLIEHFLGADLQSAREAMDDGVIDSMNDIILFIERNRGFVEVGRAFLMACFVWLFFKFSPRMGLINLWESIYIQVWVVNQMVILRILTSLISMDFAHSFGILCIFLPFLCVDYKQLFGFSWWGTLWRTLLVMFFTMIVAYALIVAILIIFYVK